LSHFDHNFNVTTNLVGLKLRNRRLKVSDDGALKVKLSRYTPWRRMGGEEVEFLLILNLGH
jgi:hypothetical protein